jgi:uncharacterized membrane protein YfhO
MTILRTWWILFGLQVLVALVIFSPFLTGQAYFAYFDIGSDSYAQVLPDAMHMARKLAAEGFTGWSFEFGLGGPTALLIGDTLGMLQMLGGPDHVVVLRIWVYLLKIILGGTFFLLFVRHMVDRWETAVICALAYSFCGFMVINGQWDIEATEFVFYPMILWAIMNYLRTGNVIVLPLTVAFVVGSSVFFVVSTGIFIAFTGLAFVFTSNAPRAMFKKWVFQLVPLIALGYLLSAPRLLPLVMQVLDSSRVSGGDSLFQKIASESLDLNSWPLILIQMGGLFHKDIFGIGSSYKGYQNYLEGPGFYVGVTFLLLIPQLWNETGRSRKLLLLGLLIVCAYFVFPVFRNLALGFSAPYFRVSTLWISLVLLLLAAKAVDLVIKNGVNSRLVLLGIGSVALLLLLVVQGGMGANVAKLHVIKILGIMLLASLLLLLACRGVFSLRLVPLALLGLVVMEATLIARPSYIEGRTVITPEMHAHSYNDGTLEALQAIRQLDKGIFRIEKTYDSVSLADSLAQDYMGIKSYYLHSRGVVDFNIGLGLIPPPSGSTGINYTNWLPNAGNRYMLNSLLSVKYVLSKTPLKWEGLELYGKSGALYIYKNNYALPFGIVQTRQVTQKMLVGMSVPNVEAANMIRDVALINAVVLEQFDTRWGERFALDELLKKQVVPVEDVYHKPAKKLQQTGLVIISFASNKIVGSIRPDAPGMLVFSIPFNAGWTLKIDSQPVPLVRANYGMLAATVAAGPQVVELDFELPGQRLGLLLGALGLMLLVALVVVKKRGGLARRH